jgi:hypothetical protein
VPLYRHRRVLLDHGAFVAPSVVGGTLVVMVTSVPLARLLGLGAPLQTALCLEERHGAGHHRPGLQVGADAPDVAAVAVALLALPLLALPLAVVLGRSCARDPASAARLGSASMVGNPARLKAPQEW